MTRGPLDQAITGDRHVVEIDPDAELGEGSRLRIRGNNCTVRIGPRVKGDWDLSVDDGGSIIIGAGTTCGSAHLAARGEAIVIGEDCMLSYGIEIRSTDTHAIYDIDSGEAINPDQPVAIGDHVWIGKRAMVLKGARIGAGSVLGAGGVLSGELPPLAIGAGVPAETIRTGVTWTRRIGTGALEDDEAAMKVVSSGQ